MRTRFDRTQQQMELEWKMHSACVLLKGDFVLETVKGRLLLWASRLQFPRYFGVLSAGFGSGLA